MCQCFPSLQKNHLTCLDCLLDAPRDVDLISILGARKKFHIIWKNHIIIIQHCSPTFLIYFLHSLSQHHWTGPTLPVCVSVGNQGFVGNTKCAGGICMAHFKSQHCLLWEGNPGLVLITKKKKKIWRIILKALSTWKVGMGEIKPYIPSFPLYPFLKASTPFRSWGSVMLNKPGISRVCGASHWLGIVWLGCQTLP